MWVEEAARGQGIAREILHALMAEAGHAGVEILRLETGEASHAALALYEKTGFKLRGPLLTMAPTLSASSWKDLSIFGEPKSQSC